MKVGLYFVVSGFLWSYRLLIKKDESVSDFIIAYLLANDGIVDLVSDADLTEFLHAFLLWILKDRCLLFKPG